MNIYFAGSIRGNPHGTEIYPLIIEQLKNHGTILTEFFQWSHNTAQPNQYVSDQAIFEDDINKLNQSDIIIAEVTGASHGCGWEICYGQYVRQIPIICLYEDGTNVSAMLTGNPYLKFYSYTSDTLYDIIETIFSKNTP